MSNKNLSRRRRGLRFRPSGGLGRTAQQPQQEASLARAAAEAEETLRETVFDQRHEREIERAQEMAAGLTKPDRPEPAPQNGVEPARASQPEPLPERSPATSGPGSQTAEPKPYEPVKIQEQPPKGFMEKLRVAASALVEKVERLIKPRAKKVHKEIILNVEPLETRVALLEEGRLEEFNIERQGDERLAGSIFKGRVRNLEEGLKAAFVDIGFEKNAFLHYWDIVPTGLDSSVELVERPAARDRKREKPRITQKDVPRLYPPGSEIVVQVTKGPIGTKGPRVTTNLVLPGRFLVLLPTSDQCGISRKIEDPQERQRLRKILRELAIPDGMGVIMRTAAEGQKKRYFIRDLALLLEEWRQIQERIKTMPAPACVYQEPDLIERTVRDFLTEDVERIVVDNADAYNRIVEMISKISPRSARKVKLYTEPQPIFDRFNITPQLESAFARKVTLPSGGYIVIDETEAMVAIDVNTGSHKSAKEQQDSTILEVNLEAAQEIARQLRLRNIGGLIVVDFIDMKSKRDQNTLYQRMKEALRRDRAKTHVLPISPLGLMEMTRQRHTESVHQAVYDDCPYCQGRGKVKSALTMSAEIQRKIIEILRKRPRDESDFQLRIVVHPMILERL
ncbi:MAG: Rne/Rng family ribonuclease, partial [Verrucomicrobiales bacterium]|nr:Rne/Rng family ribonuclease [Verrucomicrobiales bacterium]